jgi:WD40 repeat protein
MLMIGVVGVGSRNCRSLASDKPAVQEEQRQVAQPEVTQPKQQQKQATAIVRVPGVYTTAIALTPNGTLLATGGSDHTVRLWDAAPGKTLHTLKGHTVAINRLVFTPDGKTLASATGDWVRDSAPGEMKLWDVATGKERAPVKGHAGFVMSLAFSPDGQTLASASETVKIWDVAGGRKRSKSQAPATPWPSRRTAGPLRLAVA